MYPYVDDHGATLFELILATAILGLVAQLGVTVSLDLMPRYRLQGATQQLAWDFMRARRQAVVKKAFEKIGIEVEIKAVKAGIYFSSDPGNPDTYSHFYTDLQMYTRGTDPDPQTFMESFTSWHMAQKSNNWSGRNTTRWSDPAYDELWKQGSAELDPVKRAALFIKMNDMVVNQHAIIPVVWRNPQGVAANRLRGMNLSTWDSTLWRLSHWYKTA